MNQYFWNSFVFVNNNIAKQKETKGYTNVDRAPNIQNNYGKDYLDNYFNLELETYSAISERIKRLNAQLE